MKKASKIRCPLCGLMIPKGRLRGHKEMKHGERPSVKAAVSRPTTKKKKRKFRKKEGEVLVQCRKCSMQIKKKNLEEHRRSKHPTKAERLRDILGPDEETMAEINRSKIVVSGGGFGVGKGKRS